MDSIPIKDDRAQELDAVLDELAGQAPWDDEAAFFAALSARGYSGKPAAGLVKVIRATLGERDETAKPVLDADGKPVPDSDLRDFENVPLKDSIDEYFYERWLCSRSNGWHSSSKPLPVASPPTPR